MDELKRPAAALDNNLSPFCTVCIAHAPQQRTIFTYGSLSARCTEIFA